MLVSIFTESVLSKTTKFWGIFKPDKCVEDQRKEGCKIDVLNKFLAKTAFFRYFFTEIVNSTNLLNRLEHLFFNQSMLLLKPAKSFA
jgi:hypothetical protein